MVTAQQNGSCVVHTPNQRRCGHTGLARPRMHPITATAAADNVCSACSTHVVLRQSHACRHLLLAALSTCHCALLYVLFCLCAQLCIQCTCIPRICEPSICSVVPTVLHRTSSCTTMPIIQGASLCLQAWPPPAQECRTYFKPTRGCLLSGKGFSGNKVMHCCRHMCVGCTVYWGSS